MPKQPVKRSAGFTLVEMLLVVALLVMLGAIVTPSLMQMNASWQLKGSAESVRAAFARARVKAMRTGRVQVFRYEIDGSRYATSYWVAENDALEASPASGGNSSSAATSTASSVLPTSGEEEVLPDGIRFVFSETVEDVRSQQIAAEVESSTLTSSGVSWSRPILFYPDGTTSTAEVTVVNARGAALAVSLRGLTGVATVGEHFRLDGESP